MLVSCTGVATRRLPLYLLRWSSSAAKEVDFDRKDGDESKFDTPRERSQDSDGRQREVYSRSRNSDGDRPDRSGFRSGSGRFADSGKSGRDDYRRDRNDYGRSRDRYSFSASLEKVDFSKIELPPVKKELYEPADGATAMTAEEAKKWRKARNIAVAGLDPIPTPAVKFSDIRMPDFVTQRLKRKGFAEPSPIQAQAWPVALSGRDMIGISATGSGKTLAFALPGITHITHQPHLSVGGGPISLVLVPTRELANQVRDEWDAYAGRLRSAALFGGQGNRHRQLMDLRNGAHTIIACPGRLKDLVQQGMVTLRRVSYVVLDEADRMLDMGFEPQVREILGQVRPERQTLLWSATWPTEVQKLARDFLNDPVAVTVGSTDAAANKDITQQIEFCAQFEKTDRLVEILRKEFAGKKVLVFVQTKMKCGFTVDELRRKGVNAYELHGDLTQAVRDRAMQEFRERRDAVLVATDVAARGIDVRDIAVVVNYDFPQNIESYIHRIGRTARAGDKGTAISFITPYDYDMARDLVKVLETSGQRVPPQLAELRASQQRESERRGPARSPRFGSRPGTYSRQGGSSSARRGEYEGSRSRTYTRSPRESGGAAEQVLSAATQYA